MSLEGWPEHVPPDIYHESVSFTDLIFPILSPQSNVLAQSLIISDHGSDENKYEKMSSTGFNDSIGGGASSTGNFGNGQVEKPLRIGNTNNKKQFGII